MCYGNSVSLLFLLFLNYVLYRNPVPDTEISSELAAVIYMPQQLIKKKNLKCIVTAHVLVRKSI